MPNNFLYDGWIKNISCRFKSELETILAEHNFEYGPEFEISLCRILRTILPDRYGICRGFLVDQNGNKAGDDIIIYERSRFPTIALRGNDDYSRKEYIPIEAAYAYIEAKHTLNIHGTNGQSLFKACEQVSNVKTIVSKRKSVDCYQLGPYSKLPPSISFTSPENYPDIQNPFYTIIISRNVREKASTQILSDEKDILTNLGKEKISSVERPDLIVLDDKVIILPVIPTDRHNVSHVSPFFIKGKSEYHVTSANSVGFGIAIFSLLFALDWINLGVVPWKEILKDAIFNRG